MRYAVLVLVIILGALGTIAYVGITQGGVSSFRMSGRVVDPAGNPLDGASVTVEEHRGVTMGWKKIPSKRPYTRQISGQFDIATGSCAGASLTFHKPGYLDERMGLPNGSGLHLAADGSGRYEIVMVPALAPVQLITMRVEPTVAAIAKPTSPPEPGTPDQESQWNKWFSSRVRVEVPRTSDGSADLVQVTERGDAGNTESYWVPRQLTLSLCDEISGGFVRFDAQPGRRISRQMVEAPPDGYQRSLVFDQQSMTGASWFYVYVHADGVYGRMMLYPAAVGQTKFYRPDRCATFDVELQPDGSRDLRFNESFGHFEAVGGEERKKQ